MKISSLAMIIACSSMLNRHNVSLLADVNSIFGSIEFLPTEWNEERTIFYCQSRSSASS